MPPLTLREAAEKIGIVYVTVCKQVLAGKLIATRFGRSWMVEASEVERYKAENKGRPGRKKANHS